MKKDLERACNCARSLPDQDVTTKETRSSLDRRAVLRLGAAGSLMTIAVPLACSQGASPTNGPVAAGNLTAAPVGTLRVITSDNLILARDAAGLYAMSAVCTHAGCTVGAASGGLLCGCHGSTFDSNGVVTKSPATTNLQHYQVDLAANGDITIRGDLPISSTARTATS